MASRYQVLNIFNQAVLRFPDAVSSANFKQDGVYNPDTDTVSDGLDTEVKDVLKISFDRNDIDGTNVTTGDYQLMLRFDDLPIDPTTSTKVTYKGKNVVIRSVMTDPVDATYTIHVRPS